MKTAVNIVKITAIVCLCLCILLYFVQEKLIFFPEKLAATYKFKFDQGFEELYFKTADNIVLNGVLFKADSSMGLIFYLHGNAGSLALCWITGAMEKVRAALLMKNNFMKMCNLHIIR